MNDSIMLKGWEIIDYVLLKRNTLFNINKVEDFYVFYMGYSFSPCKDDEIVQIVEHFSRYIKEVEFKEDLYQSHNWCQIIRFHSYSDGHSLELLQMYLNEFKESDFYKKKLSELN